ncbi:CRISPR-associated protein Cas5/CasD, subtype I-E/ECOLI [Acidipropionibacterium jensenii]|uniref:CRISPR-associated protein Cas5/CasD, subtype I-E/ECOLI n=1 Tax=Acidipropionibacterium jensenii TaxID=1749 RepID=A0A448P0C6_9ACTN|nr:type I-E CRISPR-associated protein Cas5/CasD [Acidipropionibacterium jensenii]MDN6428221.1 type I-E CRISPR-associated protein Cas5/CasD [Propionibacterium sp.]MDN6625166.1 type I-E CRISPR-associated protein Cas5/CasD [Acidipropionibacterium jensenii]MDN6657522.1 type I-E CRISPR-associated protein Cas5/CasD [Acidipropionibacterium jensenii]VEI03669.1 CRISPR-associated protein Cas5/CasD, subtype I-E/ECOLI [Acidipropionibacterium jensenii]
MTVLLLRLAGPLQSWGADSRFQTRSTRREPTKSGVLGLLAAAKGIRRTDSIEDLLTLRFGVRTDQPGTVLRDFQTAHDWAHPDKKGDAPAMPLSNRYYLSDAVFIAGVEGGRDLLEGLDGAIRDPQFPLYLGRRSCPAEGQISLGLVDGDLISALKDAPWHASLWQRRRLPRSVDLPIAIDAESGQLGDTVRDVPISFDPTRRQYGWRSVTTDRVSKPNPDGDDTPDWFAALGGV